MSASSIIELLRKRYQAPEWALIDELHDGTGAAAKRRFDAVAFGCWPSNGFVRLGFEVKISRADFARELEDHEKRRALEERCHQVWFVVAAGVCQPREIPEPWGCMVVAGDGLRAVVKAQHRAVGPVPEPMAIAAIRRMVEADIAYRAHHYMLDGAELTQDDLDAKVNALCSELSHRLTRERQALSKERGEIETLQRQIETNAGAWWDVWRQVLDASRGYGRSWEPPSQSPPTRAQIIEAVARLKAQGQADLADSLRAARDKLDAALVHLEATRPPEVET